MSTARTGSMIRAAACAGALGVLAAAGAARAQVVLAPDTPVAVTGGEVQGAASERNSDIVAFQGIPFAAPPVGDLRWKPPAPVVPWDGVRDGSRSGATCVQQGGMVEGVTQSEDCLFLNVWAPRETAEPRPVLYWIHGGGYTGGSGSTALYDGTALAADGAVVVTINYRLNVFGFLAHPALSAESPNGASGNYGVMDMVAGLEWVRDNVAAFGGDPDRVTIFGESAGGGAVMSVMVVPQAAGLFHGAIAQSNWINGWDRPLDEADRGWEAAETQGLRVAEALGATGGDALAAMRAASAAEVLEASNADAGSPFGGDGNVWAPNVDGWVIPDDPLAMYRTGRQHDVPLITGLNGNEGSLFTQGMDIADAEAFADHVRNVYPDLADRMLAHYDASSPDAAKAAIDKLIHDLYFAGPVRAHAEAHGGVSSSAWLYQFTHEPPTSWGQTLGSHHAAELVYVFGSLTRQEQGGESPLGLSTVGAYTDTDMRLSETMRGYWVQFAATGDPNRDDLPAWPAFTPETDQHLELSSVVAPGSGVDVAGAALWEAREDQRRD